MTVTELPERRDPARLAHDHWAFLASYAASLCGDFDDAQDLVQRTFERLLSTSQLPERNQRAWLTTVLRNLFVDELRKNEQRPRRVECDLSHLPVENDVDDDAQPPWGHLTANEVRDALDVLDEPLAAAFMLYAFERRGYADIAAALGTSVSTVGTRILRARRQLRRFLSTDNTEAPTRYDRRR